MGWGRGFRVRVCTACHQRRWWWGVTGIAHSRFGGGVIRAFPEEPREGQQGTGLGRAEGFPGLWRGLPPQNLRSLHLLCEDASQPMASPGAPSRPPPSAPPGPACHGARRKQGPAPGDIACVEELAGFRAVHPRRRLALTAAPVLPSPRTTAASGSTGQAWSSAASGRRRDPSRGSSVGAASTARAPAAAARALGRVRAAGAGRTCVCLSPAPGGHAGRWLRGHFLCESVLAQS